MRVLKLMRFVDVAHAVAASVLLCLVGCGEEKSPEVGVTFLLDWKSGPYHAGFFVADAKGYFREEKLRVTFEEASGAAQAATIVGDGKYPLGLSTGDATLMAANKGAKIIAVAAIYQRNPVVVFSPVEKPIKQPQDLIGKKVGIPLESIAYKEFLAFLKKVGIEANQLEIIGVGFDTSPLLNKQVDALVGYSNNAAVQIETKGQAIHRLYLADYGVNPYGTVVVCSKDFLAANRNTVHRFLRASLRGWQLTYDDSTEALKVFLETRKGHDPTFAKHSMAATRLLLTPLKSDASFTIGYQYFDRWEETKDVLVSVGLLPASIKLDSVVDNTFFTQK